MIREILFQPNFKRKLWSIFGQSFYTKMALFPQSHMVKRSLRSLYNLGFDHPYRSWPTVVAIEINTCCNRKCAYCPNHKYDRAGGHKGRLDESLFQRIIDDLAQHGYFRPVIQEVVERYLDCGNPMCGFARIRCPDCGEERLLMFSCKTR